jgi:hypothetical protein
MFIFTFISTFVFGMVGLFHLITAGEKHSDERGWSIAYGLILLGLEIWGVVTITLEFKSL